MLIAIEELFSPLAGGSVPSERQEGATYRFW